MVNDPDIWEAFLSHIDTNLEVQNRTLKDYGTSDRDLYRAQGYIQCLDNLKKMRSVLNGD